MAERELALREPTSIESTSDRQNSEVLFCCFGWNAMMHLADNADMPNDAAVRSAQGADFDSVFTLAKGFATSFVVEGDAFAHSFQAVLADPQARLSVVVLDGAVAGYVLAFKHPAFYANGPVAWVEEIVVRDDLRGRGLGRLLMDDIEAWVRLHGVRLLALATRRAAPFYRALGYEESATYFRKIIAT